MIILDQVGGLQIIMKGLGIQGDPDDPFDQQDSVLSDQNNFDLHNKIYELTSRCNSLEYERTKMMSEYEIALRELKHKNTILQRLCSEKQEREEKLNLVVLQLRGKMAELEEENQMISKDLNSMLEKNRVTPNFNSPELYHDTEILTDLLQKEEKIQKLESQLEQIKRGDEKSGRLDKELFQREKEQLKQQMDGLQQEKQSLESAFREAEDKIIDLQEKIRHLESQKKKIISKYDKNEEQSKFLEQERKHHEKQKKTLQQEIYRLTSELSQVRAASFNDKLDFKKQINVIRSEYEQQKMRNRGQFQDKISQNKRLKESLYTLGEQNDQLRGLSNQNQQLRVKVDQLNTLCEKVSRQNEHLSQQNERLVREGSKWEQFADESIKRGRDSQYQMVVRQLEQQVQSKSMDLKESARKMRQWESKAQQLKMQLQNKNELLQILKIQKKQHDSRLKQQVKRKEEIQTQKTQKQKVISHLESQIRALKDDNRQLEIANDELTQKIQTLKLINSDIENIKQQLQLEKQYYHQMRRQEEHLRKAHKQPSHQVQELGKEIESLRERNQALQYRISEIESESDRRAFDLKLQEEENRRLKDVAKSPRTMDLQPLVQHSKRTQFNAVFLQNKILQLQKEITGLKSIKEKEFEEYKKAYAKRMTQKYQLQMQKSQGYLRQLQKNNELLSQKLRRYEQQSKQMTSKMNNLMKENYQAKLDYSQTLQQLNILLQKYKALEDSYREMQYRNNQKQKSAENTEKFKSHLQKATKINQQLAYRLQQANHQITKLNEVLMRKEGQLKSMRNNSSVNSSFVSQQQAKNNPNIPIRMRSQHEHSSDGDSLRSWVKKSPNFSRI